MWKHNDTTLKTLYFSSVAYKDVLNMSPEKATRDFNVDS